MTHPTGSPAAAQWHDLLDAALRDAVGRRDGRDPIAALAAADHAATARDLLAPYLGPAPAQRSFDRPGGPAGWSVALLAAADALQRCAAQDEAADASEDLLDAALHAREASDAYAAMAR